MTTFQLIRIALKTLIFFIVANLLWLALQPLPVLESLSLYNGIVRGRPRLPYGISAEDYNLSPTRLGTMLATHEIRRPKAADEYRVIVLGDSSVWGILLHPSETLTEQLNALQIRTAEGKIMRFYNLAYPMNSVLKDRFILDEVLAYNPDEIVWMITLESLVRDNQFEPPLLLANPDRVQALMDADGLDWETNTVDFVKPTLWDQTLIGQRRPIADWLRLQAYGIVWTAAGIDQIYKDYTPRSNDFDTDVTWYGLTQDVGPSYDFSSTMAWDVLKGGIKRAQAAGVPITLVNEPVFIATGQNHELFYNAWSPRWIYDIYREMFVRISQDNGWLYQDAWNTIPASEFTDSPVHLTPKGSGMLAQWMGALWTSHNKP